MQKLTLKQEFFCKEYIKDFNGAAAAIRAGYSEKTAKEIACELLTKLHVTSGINKEIEERMKRVNIDADYVLKQAVELHEMCMNGVKDNDKVSAGVAQAAIQSLKLVGDHVNVNAFGNKKVVEISGIDGSPVKTLTITGEMSDEEAEETYKKMMG